MGLDMFLWGKRYLWRQTDDKIAANIKKNFPSLPKTVEIKEVRAEFGYWRKANQIHAWFVKNVQAGKDDCGTYYVSREDLQKLLDDVMECLDNQESAQDVLPTQSGFFFGTYDYDEYYWEDLERTRQILTLVLGKEYEGWEFYYHSSW